MRQINISGPEGNAFALMGTAKSWMKQMEYPKDESAAVLNQMMSGDYENLLNVFRENFGNICELVEDSDKEDEDNDGDWD